MPQISNDNPFYFITSVTNKRLPVFQTEELRQVLADAFNEARASAGFRVFAYALMPDHYHIITDSSLKASEVLRYLNGISARRVINYLKEKEYISSLDKLKKELEGKKEYKYSLWEHHSNTFLITTEPVLMQKVNYIHQNPVADDLAETAEHYLYSSARYWKGNPLEKEPIEMDVKELVWKKPR